MSTDCCWTDRVSPRLRSIYSFLRGNFRYRNQTFIRLNSIILNLKLCFETECCGKLKDIPVFHVVGYVVLRSCIYLRSHNEKLEFKSSQRSLQSTDSSITSTSWGCVRITSVHLQCKSLPYVRTDFSLEFEGWIELRTEPFLHLEGWVVLKDRCIEVEVLRGASNEVYGSCARKPSKDTILMFLQYNIEYFRCGVGEVNSLYS